MAMVDLAFHPGTKAVSKAFIVLRYISKVLGDLMGEERIYIEN